MLRPPNFQLIITIFFPFMVLHTFAVVFYDLSLWNIMAWCGNNLFSGDKPVGMFLLGLFFSWIVLCLPFTGFINMIYLAFFGRKQEMVYVGHESEGVARYYNKNNSDSTVTGKDVAIRYNENFDNLFRSEVFIRDMFKPDKLGIKQNRQSISGFLSIFSALILFLIATSFMFNVITYFTFQDMDITSDIPLYGAINAYDYVLRDFGLNTNMLFLLIPVMSLMWIFFSKLIPTNKRTDIIIPLPNHIKPSAVITAIPVEIHKHLNSVVTKTSGPSSLSGRRKVDSGYRYINFRCDKGFTRPVFISCCINRMDHVEVMSNIHNLISTKKPIRLLIKNDLSIILANKN